MASLYQIPTPVALERVEPVLVAQQVLDCPFMKYFPFEGVREDVLRWTQKDSFRGLQQVRGLNGKPGRVSMVGDKTYLADPGVYGEFVELDERTLAQRRNAADLSGGPIPVADLVAEAQEMLVSRRVARQKYMTCQLVVNGTYTVSAANGAVVHTDSYTQQTLAAEVAWSDHANSKPLSDLRKLYALARGQSVSFGPSSTLYLNQSKANDLLANTNPADLGDKKFGYGNTIIGLGDVNRILSMEGLPTIEIYEGGYIDDNGTFQMFLADGAGVVIGKRTTGTGIGTFRYTLNLQSPGGAPKPYTRVIDRGNTEIPGTVEVHDGFNGGLTLKFPGTIVKLTGI